MRVVVIIALALTGCVETAVDDPVPNPVPDHVSENTAITFETSACFGTCPVFSFTLDPDGSGVFFGERFVASEGKHFFQASNEQMDVFHARIAPFRPAGTRRYDWENCAGDVWTDMPSVQVRWTNDGRTDDVFWYLGCDEPSLKLIQPDLYDAWKELPVLELVEKPEREAVE